MFKNYLIIVFIIQFVFISKISFAQSDITNLNSCIVSAQYNDSPEGENFSKLIDNNTGTKYLTFHSNAWIQIYTPDAYIINKYTISSANDSPERDPKQWSLVASNDRLNWITIDSRSSQSFSERNQTKEFSFTNNLPFKYYRLILTCTSGGILQLSEIELYTQIMDHDVSITKVSAFVEKINTAVSPKITVSNFGANSESFPIYCKIIDSHNNEVYSNSANVSNLAAGTSKTVTLPNWIPTEDVIYTFKVWTSLTTDQLVGNDTLSIQTNTHKKVYIVGYSHLDLQWNWTLGTTINEYLPNTMKGNFALFEKYPEYKFSFEGAYRYMLMKKHYPSDYEKLKNYIVENKWYVAGSMIEAVDVIIPNPEALIRQILYGNRFFNEEFGKTSLDILLPDCFGFSYTLPTIASHCGLKGFSTQKFDRWGGSFPTPFSIGQWQGIDGSKITAVMKPGAYDNDPDIRENDLIELGNSTGLYLAYDYYGKIGDKGGAPTEEQVNKLITLLNNNGSSDIQIVASSSDQIFRDLSDEDAAKLPIYNGEFLMTQHATGCYTSHADLKLLNRKNELTANSAERISVTAELFAGKNYPSNELRENWINFLAHAFHDDLTGTSIQAAYNFYSIPVYTESLEFFQNTENEANQSLASKLNTNVTGIPVVVYNPLSFERTDAVEAEISFTSSVPNAVCVYNKNGKEVPSQILDQSGLTLRIVFMATVPSVGQEVYEIRESDSPCKIETNLSATTNKLENERYIVSIDDFGDVSSIYDKMINQELLYAPSKFEIRDDHSSNWPAWEIYYNDVTGPIRSYVEQSVQKTVIDSGAAQVSILVTRTNEGSEYSHKYILNAQDDGYLKVENIVNWNPTNPNGSLLKVSFPLTASNEKTTYDLGIGVIVRGINSPQLYEVPGQQWADISNVDNSYGVAILNNCKYGWDKPWYDIINLTLIHSPKGGNYTYQGDKYTHEFTYAIYGHLGNWADGEVNSAADRLNQPLKAFQTTMHDGALGNSISFVDADPTKISVMAVKKAEEENGYIIRVKETSGKSWSNVNLNFTANIITANEVDGMEEFKANTNYDANSLTFNITPFQPKTFFVKLTNPFPTTTNDTNNLPDKFELYNPYPNPSNNSVAISFYLPKEEKVKIIIYDVLGKEVKTLLNNVDFSNGKHEIYWDHTNNFDQTLVSGVYFIRVSSKNYSGTQKAIIMK